MNVLSLIDNSVPFFFYRDHVLPRSPPFASLKLLHCFVFSVSWKGMEAELDGCA